MAGISEEDLSHYDRQIRMWGMEAQARMRGFKCLLVGLHGVSAEVAKNVVLAGIGALHVVDHNAVSEANTVEQFCFVPSDQGSNKAQAAVKHIQLLNPRVEVRAMNQTIHEVDDDVIQSYDAVVLSNCTVEQELRLSSLCRKHEVVYFITHAAGLHSFFFSDLIQYSYMLKDDQTSSKHTVEFIDWKTLVQRRSSIAVHPRRRSLGSILNSLLSYHTGNTHFAANNAPETNTPPKSWHVDFPPVASILGGLLAQEILKVITRDFEPLGNLVLVDSASTNTLAIHVLLE